jgi:transcriptional regulator with XRE-family HTH domain
MNKPPIVPAQIRAARGLLDWSQGQLAAAAGLGLSTIRDIEGDKRGNEVGCFAAIIRALENEGITFLPSDGNKDGPGVRLQARRPNIIQKPSKMENGLTRVLPLKVEWKGKLIIVCVTEDALEDLENGNSESDSEYIAIFDRNRRKILDAAATVIDDPSRITPDGRVYIHYADLAS